MENLDSTSWCFNVTGLGFLVVAVCRYIFAERCFTYPSMLLSFFLSLWFRTTDGWMKEAQESEQRKKYRENKGRAHQSGSQLLNNHRVMFFLFSTLWLPASVLPLCCLVNHIQRLSSLLHSTLRKDWRLKSVLSPFQTCNPLQLSNGNLTRWTDVWMNTGVLYVSLNSWHKKNILYLFQHVRSLNCM